MEVPELVDTGVGELGIVVVHHRGALEVPGIDHLGLEIERAPAELALGVVEVAVERTGVDHRSVGACRANGIAHREPVRIEHDVDLLIGGHVLQPLRVTVDGQPLVGVVEVAVVEGVADRETRDVLGGQVLRIGLPLLGRVVAHESLIQRAPDERNRLLLEVRRILSGDLRGLLGDELLRLIGRVVATEELVDQAEPHRELVGRAVVHGEHAVLVVGEIGELVDVFPHPLVRGVEQVRAVLVDLDTGLRLRLRVRVAADVRAPLEHEDALTELRRRTLGHGEPEKPRPDDHQVVVFPFALVRHLGLFLLARHYLLVRARPAGDLPQPATRAPLA